MRELIDKLEQLKKEIKKEQVIEDFLEEKEKVFQDKELILKIKEYKTHPSLVLKKEIESSPSFLAYKEKETRANLLIFSLNQKFKKLSLKECWKEVDKNENN